MKQLILCFFISLTLNSIFAQKIELEVEYEFIMRGENFEEFTFFKTLISNNSQSLFFDSDSLGNEGEIKIDRNKWKHNFGMYYDLKKDELIYNYPIFYKDYFIKEIKFSENLSWNLEFDSSKTMNILGYKCEKASLLFRGRRYIAYYTPEIPTNIGPWKFHGLPGLILKVYSEDKSFEFNAFEISIHSKTTLIENPYKDLEVSFIDFKEHKELYLKKLKDLENNANSRETDDDVTYSYDDKSMELTE